MIRTKQHMEGYVTIASDYLLPYAGDCPGDGHCADGRGCVCPDDEGLVLLQAWRGDEESWRLVRLERVVGAILARGHEETLSMIRMIRDHKGVFHVFWHRYPNRHDMKRIDRAIAGATYEGLFSHWWVPAGEDICAFVGGEPGEDEAEVNESLEFGVTGELHHARQD